jgi:hypothetical protein
VRRSQGMTLQRAVIDFRMKFWEHGQRYVALSGIKSPGDLCICFLMIWTISLFTHPLALMLFKSSRWRNLPDPYQSPKFRLVITSSPVLFLSIHLTQLYETNSLAPTTTSSFPRIKFVMFPV